MSDHPLPNESWLEYFRRTGRFSDLILLAWSQIEFNIDQLLVRQFGLFVQDKKAKILLDLSFQRKIDFLRENEILTKDEYSVVKEFQEYRNRLFHGKEWFHFGLSKEEQDKIIDNAIRAAQLTLGKLV